MAPRLALSKSKLICDVVVNAQQAVTLLCAWNSAGWRRIITTAVLGALCDCLLGQPGLYFDENGKENANSHFRNASLTIEKM